MKKLLFAFVALAAVSFASCGNAQKGGANDSDTIVAEDSIANDSNAVAGDSLATNDSTVA